MEVPISIKPSKTLQSLKSGEPASPGLCAAKSKVCNPPNLELQSIASETP